VKDGIYLVWVAVAVIGGLGIIVTFNDPLVDVAVLVLMLAPGMVLGARGARRSTPVGIVSQLLKPNAHRRLEKRLVGRTASTWNPSRVFPGGSVYGEGTAIYSLDDEEQVHLDWHPKQGRAAHFVGPRPTPVDAARRGQLRRAAGAVLGVYVIAAAAGYVAVYASTGGARGHREAMALFGALGGYFVAYFVALAILGVAKARRTAERQRDAPTAQHAE
jgi:hypothetical protein